MKLLLFLCCVLSVSAYIQHEEFHVSGCSDSDEEEMYAMDGEVKWFADFKKKKGFYPQPPFIDPPYTYPEGIYDTAVDHLQICRINLDVCRRGMKEVPFKQDPPSRVMIYPRDYVDPGQDNILICHVFGFYPAPVKVHWTKNGHNVTEGTSINVPFYKDDSFTQISRLNFIPQLGDIYGCSVEHVALKEPQTRIWKVKNEAQNSIGPSLFCGVGLTVGFFGVAIGTFFLVKGNECR